MDLEFANGLLLLGALLVVAAGLSGWLHGTVLSISVLSVAAGIAMAATGVVSASPDDAVIRHLIELALVITLFSDGLVAERELVETHWGPPARALVVAMPVTLALLALAARVLFPGLEWSEAFLLGAVLAATDPVVSSTVVTAKRVPSLIRHILNLESGLNDGLALPFVLFFLALSTGADAGSTALSVAGEVAVGAVIGLGLAYLTGRALPHLPGGGLTHRYEGVYALGVALVAFGLAEATSGNGLIAAFVAGVALALARAELPDAFINFNENVSAIFQIATFFVFGALIVATGFDGSIPALVAFVAFTLLVARPAAILAAFAGTGLPSTHKAFIAWFGPKGVASMLFALLVLRSSVPERAIVFEVAAFVIVASIFAHGLTDTVGASWVERRLRADDDRN